MNSKKSNIVSDLAKVPLLFLYVSFFTVQLFFNFDIANHPNSNTLLSTYKKAAVAHQPSAIAKTSKTKDKSNNVRLNKRFEPKAVLACKFIIEKSPVCYLETKTFVSKSDEFIPASFLLSQSFRGPPVVV